MHARIAVNNHVAAGTGYHGIDDVDHDGIHVTLKTEEYHTCADQQLETGQIRFRRARFQTPNSVSSVSSTYSLCAKANSPSFSRNSPSFPRSSVRLSEFSSLVVSKQYSTRFLNKGPSWIFSLRHLQLASPTYFTYLDCLFCHCVSGLPHDNSSPWRRALLSFEVDFSLLRLWSPKP